METTKSKRVIVEIRRFSDRPVYFKSNFVGGSMVKDVLILNPDAPEDEEWLCINASTLKKLPTNSWCKEIADSAITDRTIYTKIKHPRVLDQGVIVWRGFIGASRVNLLMKIFEAGKEENKEARYTKRGLLSIINE